MFMRLILSSCARLGGWKSEQPVRPGFNQPSLWVLIEVAMTEVLMIFTFTFTALIPLILFLVRRRSARARAAGTLNRRLLSDPFMRYVLKVEVQCVVRCLAQTGPGAKIARRSLYGEAGEGEESLELGRPREREITGGTSAGLFGGFGGLKFARKATTKKTSTDIGELDLNRNSSEAMITELHDPMTQTSQGDAMVSSWLPVEDVLEGLQADLNQKLQDNEEVQ
eukprot:s2203_g3.t2